MEENSNGELAAVRLGFMIIAGQKKASGSAGRV